MTQDWVVINGVKWATMQPNGVVFLPAAGYRNGTSVSNVGTYGNYWSASKYNASSAYRLYFDSSDVDPSSNYGRYRGRSVRLVSEL